MAERKLALGKYPVITLPIARRPATALPGRGGKAIRPLPWRERVAAVSTATTFGGVAQEYIRKREREGRPAADHRRLRWPATG